MFPTLFDSAWIGIEGAWRFTIPTYFLAIALGFVGAVRLAWREAVDMGIDRQKFLDFAIWMLIAGVLGARLMHVVADGFFWDYVHLAFDPFAMEGKALQSGQACLSNAQCLGLQERGFDIGGICRVDDGLCYPQRDPFRWLKFWAGGLTIYGALIACTLVGAWLIRRWRLGAWRVLDLGGYGIPFGLFLGRLGCLGAGCCFGGRCDIGWLGIRFPEGSLAYRDHLEHYPALVDGLHTSLAVWPTQLISAGYAFVIFAIAYFWVRPNKRFHGQVFLTTAVLYGIARFGIEFVRADQRGTILGLSTSQAISIPVVLIAGWLLYTKWRAATRQG